MLPDDWRPMQGGARRGKAKQGRRDKTALTFEYLLHISTVLGPRRERKKIYLVIGWAFFLSSKRGKRSA